MSVLQTVMGKRVLAAMILFGGVITASAANAIVELPDLLSTSQLEQEFSKFPAEPIVAGSARSERLVVTIYKATSNEKMTVALDGNLLYTWATSTGSEKWEDAPSGSHEFTTTPVGRYHVIRMVKDYFSQTWQAPMPDAIFFTRGIAIHATSHVDLLGTPVSGGCVRLEFANAETLWNLVKQTGTRNTVIVVTDQPLQPQPSPSPTPAP